MRQEMYRLNTMNPSLSGDELFAQVIASHSQHLPSVQAMTYVFTPNPSVRSTFPTPTDGNKVNMTIPTASPKTGFPTPGRLGSGNCYNPTVITEYWRR